jgi:hypothetical protein
MANNSEFAKKNIRDRYIAVLELQKCSGAGMSRGKEYLIFYPDKRLQEHNKNEINAFLRR